MFQPIPLSWAQRQSVGAVASGLSLDFLYDRALIRPRFGDGRDGISPAQLSLFYASIVFETDDGGHALTNWRIPPSYGLLAFNLMMGNQTLENALAAVIRLYDLSPHPLRIGLMRDGEETRLIVRCDSDATGMERLLEDCYLTYFYMGLSLFLGRPFPLTRVSTRDAQHMNIGGFHWASRAPVSYAAVSGLHFPTAMLAAKRAPNDNDGDDFLWQAFRRWLSFVESPQPSRSTLTTHDLRAAKLAVARGMSPATFRRVMNRTEGSFRRARRDALVDAGLTLLHGTADSVEAVAAQLGYADAGSFRRFMKASTGYTPGQIRDGFALPRRDPAVHQRLRELTGAFHA